MDLPKLHPLQRALIQAIEPIPTGVSELVAASLLERGRVGLGKLVTGIVRSLAPGQPMIWDPWIVQDGDVYRLFYLQGIAGNWRDPYLFRDPQSDRYYLFICASSKTPGNFQGCVGVAVADRPVGPYQILPPVLAASPENAADWAYYHMERPQVFYRYGKYHLFFS